MATSMKVDDGGHGLKLGGELRAMHFASTVKGTLSGSYSFLLGAMSSGSVNLNARPCWNGCATGAPID